MRAFYPLSACFLACLPALILEKMQATHHHQDDAMRFLFRANTEVARMEANASQKT